MHQLLGNGISMVDLPNNNNLELYINKWKTTIRLVIFHFLMTDKKKVKNFWTGMVLSVLWFAANNSTAQYIPQNSSVHRGILSHISYMNFQLFNRFGLSGQSGKIYEYLFGLLLFKICFFYILHNLVPALKRKGREI